MANTIINVDRNGYVSLTDFSPFLDTSKVAYYEVRLKKNGTLHLRFYDKKKKLVKPYCKKDVV